MDVVEEVQRRETCGCNVGLGSARVQIVDEGRENVWEWGIDGTWESEK
jgi:hypothetical protein